MEVNGELSYECVKEIYDILLKGEYIDYYKGSLVPDESIFQTIYMNSRFKDKYYISSDLYE